MLCPSTLVAGVTAAAVALAEGKTSEELDLMSVVFTQLGDTLATISVQRGIIEEKCARQQQCPDAEEKDENENT